MVRLASDQMESLIDNLPGMVFRCHYDKGLTIEYVSQGSRSLLGFAPEELIDITTFRELVCREDQPNNRKILKGISAANPRYQMVYRIRTAFGQDKWVKEDGLAIYSDGEVFTAIEGILSDVTAEKTAEMELVKENSLLINLTRHRYRFGNMVGKSPAMQRVYDIILKAARNKEVSVIIIGESGTGKELAARAIHDLSERRNGPFVPVNCSAIPENLIESEFFGHVRGAFTGASADKKGYLDLADNGTLFLDEIGEIGLSLQVKLLRALEQKCYTAVGGSQTKQSDFRIIGATNRNLQQLVGRGVMRSDFYYRINVVSLEMPPLREREEDILLLIEYFLKQCDPTLENIALPYNILTRMKNHTWPGNIRELKNLVDRFLTLGELGIDTVYSPVKMIEGEESGEVLDVVQNGNLTQAMDQFERKLILQTLQEYRWNKGLTAAALGISTRSLQRKLKKYAIA